MSAGIRNLSPESRISNLPSVLWARACVGPNCARPLVLLPSWIRLIFTPYLLLDTGGVCLEPRRGDLSKPRPTGSRSSPRWGSQALKGRDKSRRPGLGDLPHTSQNAISPFQGLRPQKGRGFGPRPLAWALIGCPFGAGFAISAASTLDVQQKMWDTHNWIKRGLGGGRTTVAPVSATAGAV